MQKDEELRGIMNSGYKKKTAYVVRVANQGPISAKRINKPSEESNAEHGTTGQRNGGHGREVSLRGSNLARFSSWCPKAMATIGPLPDTLADRCIILRMQRKTSNEQCERLRYLDGAELRQRCARFVKDHATDIARAHPEIPAALNDRAAD